MELGGGRPCSPGSPPRLRAMAALLDEPPRSAQARAARLAGETRQHQPTLAEPLIVLVIDELAALTAYLTDRHLKDRIKAALGIVLTQGRAVGVHVVAAIQDPRKEVLPVRGLFPTRIGLRLSERRGRHGPRRRHARPGRAVRPHPADDPRRRLRRPGRRPDPDAGPVQLPRRQRHRDMARTYGRSGSSTRRHPGVRHEPAPHPLGRAGRPPPRGGRLRGRQRPARPTEPDLQTIAGWPPLALLLTVELVSRVPVHRRGLAALRVVATGVIAGIAAWVSYWHMAGVAARTAKPAPPPSCCPFSVDGLIVVASISLVELAGRIRGRRHRAPPSPASAGRSAAAALVAARRRSPDSPRHRRR